MPQPLPKGLGTPTLALFLRSSIPLPEIQTNSTGAPCIASTGRTLPSLIFNNDNIRIAEDWILDIDPISSPCDFSRYVVHMYVCSGHRRRIHAKSVIEHVVSVRWVYTGFWRLLRAGINANFDVMETPSILTDEYKPGSHDLCFMPGLAHGMNLIALWYRCVQHRYASPLSIALRL